MGLHGLHHIGHERNHPHTVGFVFGEADVAGDAAGFLRQAGLVEDGADANQLPSVGIEGPEGEATALRWLDRAAERKAWLAQLDEMAALKPAIVVPGHMAAGTAVDASADAIEVTSANTNRLELEIVTHVGSWCAPLAGQTFDLIVSNPPYVAEGDAHLAQLPHEPISALVAGKDGLDDLRQIVTQAAEHLKPGAWLLLEHGFDQAQAVQYILGKQGFVSVQSRHDLAGILRCTGGPWPRVK